MRIRIVPPEGHSWAKSIFVEMPHAPRIGEKICHPEMSEYRPVLSVNYAFGDEAEGTYPLDFVGVQLG
jgi:hypothetical protein